MSELDCVNFWQVRSMSGGGSGNAGITVAIEGIGELTNEFRQ